MDNIDGSPIIWDQIKDFFFSFFNLYHNIEPNLIFRAFLFYVTNKTKTKSSHSHSFIHHKSSMLFALSTNFPNHFSCTSDCHKRCYHVEIQSSIYVTSSMGKYQLPQFSKEMYIVHLLWTHEPVINGIFTPIVARGPCCHKSILVLRMTNLRFPIVNIVGTPHELIHVHKQTYDLTCFYCRL